LLFTLSAGRLAQPGSIRVLAGEIARTFIAFCSGEVLQIIYALAIINLWKK
jgi:hypothetical protein